MYPGSELGTLVGHVVEDSKAFCREKHGDHPEMSVARVVPSRGGNDDKAAQGSVILAPFVAFSLHELLKNAMGAHVRLVGADRLDRLAPVEVRYGLHAGMAYVGVADYGGGWAAAPVAASQFLHTTNPEREPNYTYSRNFGSTFEGLGMGLPLARLHAEYLGGELHMHTIPATSRDRPAGAYASFTFATTGDVKEPDVAWADFDE